MKISRKQFMISIVSLLTGAIFHKDTSRTKTFYGKSMPALMHEHNEAMYKATHDPENNEIVYGPWSDNKTFTVSTPKSNEIHYAWDIGCENTTRLPFRNDSRNHKPQRGDNDSVICHPAKSWLNDIVTENNLPFKLNPGAKRS